MNRFTVTALSAILLLGSTACNKSNTTSQTGSATKLDDSPIKDKLKQASMNDVKVDVDNGKKVVTLTGDVKTDLAKQQAEDIARLNASGYVVANEIGVRPDNDNNAKKVDSNIDDAITSQWKSLEAQNNWGGKHIHTRVKNGVLTLKGGVDTLAQRESIERAAAQLPGVQQVVNELSVKDASR